MKKPLQDITVLVADDVPLNLIIMTHLLTRAGASIHTAANGRQVLEILDEQSIDIVLMDLQMPVLDGYETTQVIRQSGQQYCQIPVLAVTGETHPTEIKKCIKVGMNDFITKPFEPQVIYQKIVSLVHTYIPTKKAIPVSKTDDVLPSFDLTYLKEITNGETGKLIGIVENLVENAPLLLQQSIQAVRLQQWADAGGHLHKLKGLTRLFFMPGITGALQIAEERAQASTPSITALIEQIEFISSHLPVLINLMLNDIESF